MTDLDEQVRAWADRAAADAGAPVTATEAIERAFRPGPHVGDGQVDIDDGAGGRRHAHRWIAAAAAVVAVALTAGVLAVAARGDGTHDLTSEPNDPTTPTTIDTVPTGPVVFELLGVGTTSSSTAGTLEAATSERHVDQLWSASGIAAPLPRIDVDSQVVVAMTIADDSCPAVLERFDRLGDVLEPVFVEEPAQCNRILTSTTFVVAVDWSTVGPVLRLQLLGRPGAPNASFLTVGRPGTDATRSSPVPTDADACTRGNPTGRPAAELPATVLQGSVDGDSLLIGDGDLHTTRVGPDYPVQTDGNGTSVVKLPWFRSAPSAIRVFAVRAGGGGSAVAEVPSGYDPTGLQPSGIELSEPGCWTITGSTSNGDEVTTNLWVP